MISEANALRVLGKNLEHEYSLYELLRRPEVNYASLATLLENSPVIDAVVAEQVETHVKYHGYIERQRDEIARQQNNEDTELPINLDYSQVQGLSIEARQKLTLHKPESLGQAARISGITPPTISLLLVHLKRRGARLLQEEANAAV
jgi:tRNA uridine 5-carboxymethylaminomethyl modification enzyme